MDPISGLNVAMMGIGLVSQLLSGGHKEKNHAVEKQAAPAASSTPLDLTSAVALAQGLLGSATHDLVSLSDDAQEAIGGTPVTESAITAPASADSTAQVSPQEAYVDNLFKRIAEAEAKGGGKPMTRLLDAYIKHMVHPEEAGTVVGTPGDIPQSLGFTAMA